MADLTNGLLQGLQQGLGSYLEASERRKDRELRQKELEDASGFRKQSLEADFYKAGLLPKYDQSGKLIGADVNEPVMKAKRDADPTQMMIRDYQLEKIKREEEEAAKKKTPQGKIEAMSGEQKKRFDQTVGARNAVADLASAYKALDVTGKEGLLEAVGKRSQMTSIPFRGDTPYTQSLTRFEEYLGRLQSGGMIGKEEAERFRKMVPTSYDDPKIAQKKLQDMAQELETSLASTGVKPEEAEQMGLLRRGLMPQKAGATGKIKVSNGKETMMIDPQDLNDARKEGFEAMK